MNEINSIVISTWSKGFVAYLRFENELLDQNISHNNKYALYELVETYLYKLKRQGLLYD